MMCPTARLLLPILILGACGKSPTEEPHFVITGLHGTVLVTGAAGGQRQARVGLAVKARETIETVDAVSVCDLHTPGGSIIRVRGNTRLVMATLVRDGRSQAERTSLELLAGRLFVDVKALVSRDEFVVRTRLATVGVRGTRFIVSHDDRAGTALAVNEGVVTLSRSLAVPLPDGLRRHENLLVAEMHSATAVTVPANKQARVTPEENAVLSAKLAAHLAEAAVASPGQSAEAAVRSAGTALRNAPRAGRPEVTNADPEALGQFTELSVLRGATNGRVGQPESIADERIPRERVRDLGSRQWRGREGAPGERPRPADGRKTSPYQSQKWRH